MSKNFKLLFEIMELDPSLKEELGPLIQQCEAEGALEAAAQSAVMNPGKANRCPIILAG
jgi:hypothetical protein